MPAERVSVAQKLSKLHRDPPYKMGLLKAENKRKLLYKYILVRLKDKYYDPLVDFCWFYFIHLLEQHSHLKLTNIELGVFRVILRTKRPLKHHPMAYLLNDYSLLGSSKFPNRFDFHQHLAYLRQCNTNGLTDGGSIKSIEGVRATSRCTLIIKGLKMIQ